jgi:ATP-binding cassette subfamily B protein
MHKLKLKITSIFADTVSLLANSKRSFGYCWKYVPISTILLIIFSVFLSTIPFTQAKFLGSLVDSLVASVKDGVLGHGLWVILLMYTLFSALPGILAIVRNYIDKHWFIKIQNELDLEILRRRAAVDIAKLEDPVFQDLTQKAFTRGVWPIVELIESQFENLRLIFEIILGSFLAITFSWKIYLVVIVFSIPNFIAQLKYGQQVWGIWAKNSKEMRIYFDLRRFFTWRTATIESKIYQNSDNLLGRARKILHDFEVEQIGTEKKGFWYKFGAELLSDVGFFLSLYLLVLGVVQGDLAVGMMIFMISTIARLNSSMSNILSGLARQFEKNLYVKDMFTVFDTKPVIEEIKNPKRLGLSTSPKIEFRNVTFHYPGQDKKVLHNFNLTINPGQKVGIVGDNGAGKTTIIRLLLRVHDPVSGEILINDVNLKDLSTKEWWSYIGVLLQDYTVYNMKTKEAISMGRASDSSVASISEEKVIESGKMSTADSFIQEWKQKYDEMIGVEFGGVEMSKGQNQKMAIARVFYREPLLYVLDEPTASIDATSSLKIFENLENLPAGVSAILISHNYSTIRHVDKIILMEDGRIKEEGTHEELIKLKGQYAVLFKKQKKGFE